MTAPAHHRCVVLPAPWPSVHGVRTDSARSFARHTHAGFGIGWLESGAQRSASGRGPVDAFAGDLLAHNPGEVHDGRPLGCGARRWSMLHLECDVLAAMADGAAGAELVRPVFQDAGLRQAVAQALASLRRWQLAAPHARGVEQLACDEALAHVAGLLLARHTTLAPPKNQADGDLARVRARLADDLLRAPTLAELAALAGLGRFQLLRRFARAHGLPPHAWLLQQRAERARGLIRAGRGLADAALSAGFADQSHMTRVFVRLFGYTPGAWRHAVQ